MWLKPEINLRKALKKVIILLWREMIDKCSYSHYTPYKNTQIKILFMIYLAFMEHLPCSHG